MNKSIFKYITLFIILYVSVASQADIVRFLKVSDKLYRGSQPESDEDYAKLKENGIKTIINLRWDKSVEKSKQSAESLGFNFINVPMRGDGKPTVEDVQKVLNAINNKSTGEVYIHCTFGKDRTGLIAALYRVNEQGWAPEEARKEWIKMGFSVRVLHGLRSYFEEHTSALKKESGKAAISTKQTCTGIF